MAANLSPRAWVQLPISDQVGHAEEWGPSPRHTWPARGSFTGPPGGRRRARVRRGRRREPLVVEDLEAFAEAAQVSARGDEAVALLYRVFDLRVSAGELDEAAQVAFWLWWALFNNNEVVQGERLGKQTSRTLGPTCHQPVAQDPRGDVPWNDGHRSRADELLRAIVDEGEGEVVPGH